MPGIEIGDEVVVGANSLVTKSLHSNVLAAGSPAKVIMEDYPNKISQEKRLKIFNEILIDFIKYLEYHNFKIDCCKDGDNSIISIKNKNIKHEVYISYDSTPHVFSCKDNLLVLVTQSEKENIKNPSMILNLGKKTE